MGTVYVQPDDSTVYATAEATEPLRCAGCREALSMNGPPFTVASGNARHVNCADQPHGRHAQ